MKSDNKNKGFHELLQHKKNKEERILNKHISYQIGQIITIQAFKYDGTLYRQFEGCKIIADSDEFVVVLLMKTKVQELDINWVALTPILMFFAKKHFYNALITLNKSQRNNIYINLASPFFIEDEIIKYIDFDLDIKCYKENDFSVIDWQDFKKSIRNLNYPLKLIYQIYDELDLLKKQRKERTGLFSKQLVNDIKKQLINSGDI